MSFCERVVCTFTTLKCSVIRTSCNFLTSDVDECYNSTICGPYSICENLPGNYSCSCKVGFEPMDKTKQPNETNVCIGMWKLIYLYLKSLVFALSLCLCVSPAISKVFMWPLQCHKIVILSKERPRLTKYIKSQGHCCFSVRRMN